MSDRIKRKPAATSADKYVGIEIEFEMLLDYEQTLRDNLDRAGLRDFCELDWECLGSCWGWELSILDTQANYPETLNKVLAVMQDPVLGITLSNACGLHVHLDARGLSANLMKQRMIGHIQEMLSFCAAWRHNNHWCYGGDGMIPYRAGYQTLEVRYMDANLEFDRIHNYIQTLIRLAYTPIAVPTTQPETAAAVF